MSGHVLERHQVVTAELDAVFAFFEDPMNLEALTPPWLHFNVRRTTDRRVRLGTEITYRLRWQIFPMSWHSRISEYEKGSHFADEMLKGPYVHWYHRHLFTHVPGGVEIRDVVSYQLPFGPLGRLVHSFLIRPQLEAIFDYRRTIVDEMFGSRAMEVAT